jgi:hypothetical protein
MGMFPFRELEVFDAFVLDGRECDKVGSNKYLIYDELWEPKSLEVADPNMMVELVNDLVEEEDNDELHDYFFSTLISMIEAIERSGEKVTLKDLKKLAMTSLRIDEDP